MTVLHVISERREIGLLISYYPKHLSLHIKLPDFVFERNFVHLMFSGVSEAF